MLKDRLIEAINESERIVELEEKYSKHLEAHDLTVNEIKELREQHNSFIEKQKSVLKDLAQHLENMTNDFLNINKFIEEYKNKFNELAERVHELEKNYCPSLID